MPNSVVLFTTSINQLSSFFGLPQLLFYHWYQRWLLQFVFSKDFSHIRISLSALPILESLNFSCSPNITDGKKVLPPEKSSSNGGVPFFCGWIDVEGRITGEIAALRLSTWLFSSFVLLSTCWVCRFFELFSGKTWWIGDLASFFDAFY
jgi:hypothetical protein